MIELLSFGVHPFIPLAALSRRSESLYSDASADAGQERGPSAAGRCAAREAGDAAREDHVRPAGPGAYLRESLFAVLFVLGRI